jgi:hypothetical protein
MNIMSFKEYSLNEGGIYDRHESGKRKWEELSGNLSIKKFVQKFNKIRTGEFRNKEYMEVRPVFGDLNIKFVEKSKGYTIMGHDKKLDRDYDLDEIEPSKQEEGLIMVRYNDIISLFRLDNIRGEDVTYVFDKYIRTNNNPASTSMGKKVQNDFIQLCMGAQFNFTKTEIPIKFLTKK